MMIKGESVTPFNFEGLEIRDYTDDPNLSSSVAEITVPVGVRHRRAWSNRSDKYYLGLEGRLSFTVAGRAFELESGDLCIIHRGDHFSFENRSDEVARVLLVHTPSFELSQEIFEDPLDVESQ